MEVGAHILVSGLVQGVGYRYFVNKTAIALSLRGYVRNLYNGDVEIEVEGNRSLIEEFIAQVKVGPRAAQVRDIRVDWLVPGKNFHEFHIR